MVRKISGHATFRGSFDDFHHYVGPLIRNKVQTMTKTMRSGPCATPGCQHVGALDAAHKIEASRPAIIETVLHEYLAEGVETAIEANLEELVSKILAKHRDFERVFGFICRPCHLQQAAAARLRHQQRAEEPFLAVPSSLSSTNDVAAVGGPQSSRELTATGFDGEADSMDDGEHNILLSRLSRWATLPETKIHKIIAIVVSIDGAATLKQLTNLVSKIAGAKDPEGSVRSAMTSKGNNYGRVFYKDRHDLVRLHPRLASDVLELHWQLSGQLSDELLRSYRGGTPE